MWTAPALLCTLILWRLRWCLQVIELPLKHPELFESLGIAQPKVSRQLQRCSVDIIFKPLKGSSGNNLCWGAHPAAFLLAGAGASALAPGAAQCG